MAAPGFNDEASIAELPISEGSDRKGAGLASGMPVFRFSLRHLVAFFMGVSVMLATMLVAGGAGGFVLLLVACLVAAHVLATALGSRLRACADERQLLDHAEHPGGEQARIGAATSLERAPQRRSPLHSRGGTRWPWLARIVAAAMTLGGIGGGMILALSVGHRTSAGGVVIGALSFAVVSGWIAFLGGNFYCIFRKGWRDALNEPSSGKPR